MVSGSAPPSADKGLRTSFTAPRSPESALNKMGDRFGADVARGAVADPIGRVENAQRRRSGPQSTVAEAQTRRAVVFDFSDEMIVLRAAIEQIAHRAPLSVILIELAVQRRRRQCAARLLARRQRCRRRQWVNIQLALLLLNDERVASIADRPQRPVALKGRPIRKAHARGFELFCKSSGNILLSRSSASCAAAVKPNKDALRFAVAKVSGRALSLGRNAPATLPDLAVRSARNSTPAVWPAVLSALRPGPRRAIVIP